MTDGDAGPDTPRAIACDLGGVEDHERDPHRRAAEVVLAAVRAVEELPDGYALRLEAGTKVIEQAGAFVARERLCCPFFHFSLDVEPEGGPVRLKLGGREGVKEFIEKNLIPELSASPTSRGA